MRLRILFFATLKDMAGTGVMDLDLPDGAHTVADARAALATRLPALEKGLARAVAARNEEFAFPHEPIADGDTLAFFPPVSGGQGRPQIIQLLDHPYSLDEITAAITTDDAGALCIFSGMVRGESAVAGEAVVQTDRLHYEAYVPMATAKMAQVAEEIRAQWPGVIGIAVVQRTGTLEVGQPTVLIACTSAHRNDGCFEAARYGIDRLKEIVPVWKKEIHPDGAAWVEGKYMPDVDDKSG